MEKGKRKKEKGKRKKEKGKEKFGNVYKQVRSPRSQPRPSVVDKRVPDPTDTYN